MKSRGLLTTTSIDDPDMGMQGSSGDQPSPDGFDTRSCSCSARPLAVTRLGPVVLTTTDMVLRC